MVFCLLLLILGFYLYMTAKFDYWKRRGVPYVEPELFFGSFRDMLTFKTDTGRAFQKIYNNYKGHKFVGAYSGRNPVLIVLDPDLIKFVMTKGFQFFVDRANSPKLHHDYLQNHLFNMEDGEWREMRRKLTPTFTSGKMKKMFILMEKCGKQLEEEVEKLAKPTATINCKDLISRFTSDIIASCAYGLEMNSIRERNNEFYTMTQRMFVSSKMRVWKRAFLNIFPYLFNLLRLQMTDKYIQKYLPQLVKETISHREANNISRNDFLDMLLKIRRNQKLEDDEVDHENGHKKENEKGEIKYGLTLEEISSQTFVFFGAGFETAASTLTFCLYELSRRQDIQGRLRAEVVEVLRSTGGRVTYDAIQQMAYMEMVLNETLRMYASLPVLTRRCVAPIRLPDSDLVLEEGIRVMIPIYALHHDPQFYPQPDTFDPERFTDYLTSERHPYTHLPFGEGPRMCIGMRFGKMQVKMGLAALLPKFQFSLPADMPRPLPISPASTLTTPALPVRLTVSKWDS